MKLRLLLLLLWVFVCAFSVAGQSVNEGESWIVINEKTADVSLTVESRLRTTDTPVELTLLDNTNAIRAIASQPTKFLPGKRNYKYALSIADIMKHHGDEMGWWRLSYRVGEVRGIVSLSELLRDDFDLRAAAFQRVIPGEPMRVRVRSLNPFTERAVKGVAIKAELVIEIETESDEDEDEDELKLQTTARTDGDGFAVLEFAIPDVKLDGDGAPELKIIGKKNGIVRDIEEDIEDDDAEPSTILTTDKPLYQPGQIFNARALLLDANHTIIAGGELEFTIEDEEGTDLFRQKVTTSAYGIASISWPIPENAKLGMYRFEVDGDGISNEDRLEFKVTRYDLPNFSVTATPDKSYYLLNDTDASISVKADYLFGKPVTNGRVRVVRESEREWNYREQKYDVKEGDSVDGTADASGKYVARFDLRKDILELRSREWTRYEDLSFAAYYTDLTTNRTEQRRFDIRLTKEPIHIYLMPSGNRHRGLPLSGYISTFYADGTPAECNVEISDETETVARFKTSSIGGGKFVFRIPQESIEGSNYDIRITAHDKKGQTGTFEESFYINDEDAIQIHMDKAIYKPRETIEMELLSSQQSGYVYVDVVKNWVPVDSRVVELHKGKAQVSIPYKPSFRGDLVIAAYSDKRTSYWSDEMRAVRGIVYPEQQNLLINAKFTKEEYRPGEDAMVRFAVYDGSRKPVESAIGLGVFDKAIEERARTESAFGEGLYSRVLGLMGYQRSFGGIALKDLNELDLSRPISAELQLAAEIMLSGGWYYPSIYHSNNRDVDASSIYKVSITAQLKPIFHALQARYEKDRDHPTDQKSLERIVSDAGINYQQLLDPWGQPYISDFSIDRTQNIVTIKTAGPDKKPGTSDDFTAGTYGFHYFRKTGEAIDRVADAYPERTESYIRDIDTLIAELAKVGIDRTHLKDRWGRDYRITFEVVGRHHVIRLRSLGPDGVYEPRDYSGDDFDVWQSHTNYFGKSELAINRILSTEVNQKKRPFPRSEAEFVNLLRSGGLDLRSIQDGYGRSVYVVGKLETKYTDKTKIENGKTTITPTTEEVMSFTLRTEGADTVRSNDDADLATFSGAITEAYRGNSFGKADVTTVVYPGAKGAIRGTITDANGAVVPGVAVVAVDEADASKQYSTESNAEGNYLLGNLPSGKYTVRVPAASGFQEYAHSSIQVKSQTLVELNIVLSAGSTSATVEVTAEASEVNQTTSMMATNVKTSTRVGIAFSKVETSTPRLREYFPETLVWQPELLTDKNGKAELNFKMGDNITTWKMFAIASNKKGKVGVVEKEITAFQPFFVDLDPPKFLTEGDEIHLPTQVRNYTEKKQKVDVTMDKADWFAFIGSENKHRIDVGNGASQNAVFGFKAVTPVNAGKQRVTAIGQSDSDAIEKPVRVKPNGEEIVQTNSRVFNSSTRFDVNYPENVLPNTQRAELKIYPNLFSHVAESVEGMLERPYGCGEQTISSTYPNLMILKFVKNDSPLREKAQRYLQKGYERLTGYQVGDGGFSYWGGKDASDVALTAYALRFLNDAKEFIDVDDNVIARAENRLISQQRADGSWSKMHRWETNEDAIRTKLITTYIARSFGMSVRPVSAGAQRSKPSNEALDKALAYLKTRNAEIDEPYALALFGLASLDAGDTATAKQVAAKLESMAIAEGTSVYWKLETNTPFYGWGTAGRVETTALVLQLLTRVAKIESKPASEFASKGLMFLLKNKDRYGVWYSTQTTINVLDAFLALLAGEGATQGQTINISVNGIAVREIAVPAGAYELINVDLNGKLAPAENTIEVTSSTTSPVMVQTVATHYIDWKDSKSSSTNVGESRALRLDYKCDKANAAIMDEISCSVEAERIGFKGYGMLLAEIGTPPGADVSRESLEAALQSDWSLSKYDVLPDRIVFYMWSKAGGTKFNFKFRPRYGINAQTPASIVYDYYNPEAHATVVPLRFNVR